MKKKLFLSILAFILPLSFSFANESFFEKVQNMYNHGSLFNFSKLYDLQDDLDEDTFRIGFRPHSYSGRCYNRKKPNIPLAAMLMVASFLQEYNRSEYNHGPIYKSSKRMITRSDINSMPYYQKDSSYFDHRKDFSDDTKTHKKMINHLIDQVYNLQVGESSLISKKSDGYQVRMRKYQDYIIAKRLAGKKVYSYCYFFKFMK